jgi:hypothetical protein
MVAALALTVPVVARVRGVAAADRARVAVHVAWPDGSVTLVWPRPEHWTARTRDANGRGRGGDDDEDEDDDGNEDDEEGAGWQRVEVPVHVVQPAWAGSAALRLTVVWVPFGAFEDEAVPLSSPCAYHVAPSSLAHTA